MQTLFVSKNTHRVLSAYVFSDADMRVYLLLFIAILKDHNKQHSSIYHKDCVHNNTF